MNKKIMFSLFVLVALVFSFTYVFAADMAQDVNNSINKTENTVNNAGNTVKDAAENVVNGAKNAVDNVANGTKNAVEDVTGNNNNNRNTTTGNTNNYNATRTSTQGTLLGMNATTWTWIIMGITAIAIIALVWYYSSQITTRGYDDGND